MDILGNLEADLGLGSGTPASDAPAAPDVAPAVPAPAAVERFAACLAFTWLPQFDGQSLHVTPHDAGGATAWGVTLSTYAAWRRKQGIADTTVSDLASASKDGLAKLIRAEYWDAVHGDELPAGVDLLVYDFGFGSGSGTSCKVLQAVLGVPADGALGPKSLGAAAAMDRGDLIRKLAARHEAFYQSLHDYQFFGHGWTNRNNARLVAALATLPPAADAPVA